MSGSSKFPNDILGDLGSPFGDPSALNVSIIAANTRIALLISSHSPSLSVTWMLSLVTRRSGYLIVFIRWSLAFSSPIRI